MGKQFPHHWPSARIPKLVLRIRSSNPSAKQREVKRPDLQRPQEMRLSIALDTGGLVERLGKVKIDEKEESKKQRQNMYKTGGWNQSNCLAPFFLSEDTLNAKPRVPGGCRRYAWQWERFCRWILSLNCISASDRDSACNLTPRSRLFRMFS